MSANKPEPGGGAEGGNVFAGLPAPGADEAFNTLLAHPCARVERIVSHGHASPPGFWYDQAEDEWVMLLAGSAALGFDDGTQRSLQPGDWVWLPAHCRHRVERSAPGTVWLALHLPAGGTGPA